MSLLYFLACIIIFIIVIASIFYLLPGIFGIAEQTSFGPSNYENLIEG